MILLLLACKDDAVDSPPDDTAPLTMSCPSDPAPDLPSDRWSAAGAAPGGDIYGFAEGQLGLFAVSTMNGMYRSQDHGQTWNKVLVEVTHGAGQVVAYEDQQRVVYTTGGVFDSHNGQSFEYSGFGGPEEEVEVHGLVRDAGDLLAIDSQSRVWVEEDDGTWSARGVVTANLAPPHKEENKFEPDETWWFLGRTDTALFAVQHGGDLWRSLDHGSSWSLLAAGGFDVRSLTTQGSRLGVWGEGRVVVVDGDEVSEVHTGESTLTGLGWFDGVLHGVGEGYVYTVQGDSLVNLGTLEAHGVAGLIASGDRLVVGHQDGVLTSQDGRTFSQASGLVVTDLGPLLAHPICESLVWVGTQCERGLFASDDWGSSVEYVDRYFHYVMVPQVAPSEPTTLWVTTDDVVLKSTNLGLDWEQSGEEVLIWHLHGLGVHPRRADTVLVGTVGSGGESDAEDPEGMRVWRTDDGGATWAPSTEGLPAGSEASAHAIHFVREDPEVVLLGTFRGGDFSHTGSTPGIGLYRSTDGGRTWKEVDTGAGDVPIFDECGGRLLAATDAGLLESQDQGATWRVLKDGDYLSVSCHADTLIALDYDTAWRSDDRGATWTEWGEGISDFWRPSRQMPQVDISADGSMAYAAIPAGGLYRRPL